MAHMVTAAAEKMLDRKYKVLDSGFVRLVDYLGGDARIAESARVSYGGGTKTRRDDAGLINYLMKHHHTSPFEQVVLTFHAKMPIFVARQWIRHRTARVNEISGRYSVMKDEFYVPAPQDVRFQGGAANRQGASAREVPAKLRNEVIRILKKDQADVYASYERMIGDDIARELARINLPLSLYTEWYWQIDLHNLFHFLRLRDDSHAQLEIRKYAAAMARMARAVAPVAFGAFTEHVLRKVELSGREIPKLAELLRSQKRLDRDLERLLNRLEDGLRR